MLGWESKVYVDGVCLKPTQQVGSSAQDLRASPAWGVGGRPQSGGRKRCGKEGGNRQNFRVALKLENLWESLGRLVKI